MAAPLARGVSAAGRLNGVRWFFGKPDRDRHRIRHWRNGVAVGWTIALILHVLPENRVLVGAENLVWDATMRGLATWHWPRPPLPPITIIDVDEATWRDPTWGGGEPYRAPRDAVAALLDFAIDSHAKYIVLDIVTDEPKGVDDDKLIAALEVRAPGLHNLGQHIFFVRTMREPLTADARPTPVLRPSVLDPLIAAYPANLHNVAPYFEVAPDGVIRKWLLARPVCVGSGATCERRSVPSVQLAIDTVRRAPPEGAPPPAAAPADPPCADGPAPFRGNAVRDVVASGSPVDRLSSRILFVDDPASPANQVRTVPAVTILDQRYATLAGHYRERLRCGVAIIGQSFDAAGDQHVTPLGVLPGTTVLANAIDSFLLYGPLREVSSSVALAIDFAVVVLVAWIFAQIGVALIAVLIAGLAVAIAMAAISGLALRSWGIWLDFSLPLIGVYAHKIASDLIEAYRQLSASSDSKHKPETPPIASQITDQDRSEHVAPMLGEIAGIGPAPGEALADPIVNQFNPGDDAPVSRPADALPAADPTPRES